MGTIIEANSSFELSKCSKRVCNDASDDMSLFPDEILVAILSCLSIKEAARTSVLSSRWRFVWTYFKGKMDFVLKDWKIERDQFVTTMNEILKLHRGTGVERFAIFFDKIHYSAEDFNYWIEFAAKKSVEYLHLCLGSDDSGFRNMACITTPRSLNTFYFKSLQALKLSFIEVNDEAVEYFLSNCPNLVLVDLRHSTCLTNILIPSSSLGLKDVCVADCVNLKKIQIFARSLEQFVYFGPKISVEVKVDLHQLRLVYYGALGCASLLEGITLLRRSFPLYQLEHLSISFLYVDTYFLSHNDHFSLPKLKTLNLVLETHMGNGMLNCLHFLEAAPILHALTVNFFRFNSRQGLHVIDKRVIYKRRMRRHQCLKIVKIVDLLGRLKAEVKFVKTLIDSVESLDKLIVVPHKGRSRLEELEESTFWNIGELFENGSLSAGTELVIEEDEP